MQSVTKVFPCQYHQICNIVLHQIALYQESNLLYCNIMILCLNHICNKIHYREYWSLCSKRSNLCSCPTGLLLCCVYWWFQWLLTNWGRDKMATILQMKFSNGFLNENVWISIKIPLNFAPKGSINNIPELVQIMAWYQWGNKPLSEPMMIDLPMHICITRPQWV